MKIFWAWQYDLPGKISRHFIRGALEAAIEQINLVNNIEEPDEAFQTGALHLDYGRKGLKGSPDLAIEILKKIDDAAVFVGDVTPVGKAEAKQNDEGQTIEKKLVNPNVAIELGYALKARATENVLMVMNSHYGKREDLPFDLGHKGGPIIYKLAPDASKDQIEAEKRRLVTIFVDALREYVPKPVVEPFRALEPQIGQGIFFKDGEVLGEDKNGPNPRKYTMPFRDVMWLRVMPSVALEMPLAPHTLTDNIGRFGAFGALGERVRENAYGACYFYTGSANTIESISQYTRDGEIWGINADILRQGRQRDVIMLPTITMENTFITGLDLYMDFLRTITKMPVPIHVEAGMEGIKGRIIAHNGMILGKSGVMHNDRVTHRGILRTYDKTEQLAFLVEFFKKACANSGVPRPDGLYGRG